jgi:hypothetical protein
MLISAGSALVVSDEATALRAGSQAVSVYVREHS